MKKIAILGGGGFCREVKCLIDDINAKYPTYNLLGYFDDSKMQKKMNGLHYLGEIADINKIEYPLDVVIAIGDPRIKKNIFEKIKNQNINYPNLFHPSVIKSEDDVNFGRGNILCAGNILTCNIEIKNFVIVNLGCTIGHDTLIEDYCSLMPNVNISGEVTLRQSAYIGTGATIINKIEVGKQTIIGAGAVVANNLPENCTAVGIPAKPIKLADKNEE